MDWMEILSKIFDLCIIPLLAVITTYIVRYIETKRDELKARTDNVLLQKYLDVLNDVVTDCVLTTTQTYVESLKDKNAFTKEAQAEAFNMTYKAVMNTLSADALKYLGGAFDDLEELVRNKIESVVNVTHVHEKLEGEEENEALPEE